MLVVLKQVYMKATKSPPATGRNIVTAVDLARYVDTVASLREAYRVRMGLTFCSNMGATVDANQKPGVRYIRIVCTESWPAREHEKGDENGLVVRGNSVHTFLDAETGNILKGSWKAPVPNPVRGNIYTEGWESCISQHGAEYLR